MNKYLQTIGASLAISLVLLPVQAQRSSSEAKTFLWEKDRWAVKTGADPAAKYLRAGVMQPTRVRKIIPIERPSELPLKSVGPKASQVSRYSDTENKVFSIDADILRYKVDTDDRDIYIVIRDHGDTKAEDAPADSGERRTMIAKIPDPAVVVVSSPWRTAIARARREFVQQFHPGTEFTERVVHVKITGVGFFDYIHGQNGVALNGLELHPVFSVERVEDGAAGGAITPAADTAPIRLHKSPVNPSSAPVKPAMASVVKRSATPVKPSTTPVKADTAPAASAMGIPLKLHKSPVKPSVPGAPAGQVWVNLSTGTYWRPGTHLYGKTKRGRFMNEDEAIKIGFIPASAQR